MGAFLSNEDFEKALKEHAKRQKSSGPDFSPKSEPFSPGAAIFRPRDAKAEKGLCQWKEDIKWHWMSIKTEARDRRKPQVGSGESVKRVRPSKGLIKYSGITKKKEKDGKKAKSTASKLQRIPPLKAGYEAAAKVALEVSCGRCKHF